MTFPKLRFKNVKEVGHIKEFGPAEENVFFWIGYPHFLFYAERLKITSYCPFDFKDFPFDSHECSVSFGVSSSDINSFLLMQPNISYGDISTLSGTDEKEINVDVSHSPVPFDITISNIKPYTEKEYGYLFSFTGTTHTLSILDKYLHTQEYFLNAN